MNTRTLLLWATLLLVSIQVQGQATDEAEDKKLPPYERIMLVPFNPQFYFSDSDSKISQQSKEDIKKVRTRFRQNLNFSIAHKLGRDYQIKQMIGGDTAHGMQELYKIYDNLSYRYEAKQLPKELAPKPEKKSLFAGFGKKKETPEEHDPLSRATEKRVDNDTKFMNAVLSDPSLFAYFNETYGTDLYIFINQFEIETKYKVCLDRATNKYERDILVHFSVYDKAGQLLFGDVKKVTYHSNDNNIQGISHNTFGAVANYIYGLITGSYAAENIEARN